MGFEIKHCHYTGLQPGRTDTLALFKVYSGGALVAVIREPEDFPLIHEPEPNKNYRVDCVTAGPELRAHIAHYLPGRTFAYFESPNWHWRDNGTYEEMSWGEPH
jgi:hypothetical protein